MMPEPQVIEMTLTSKQLIALTGGTELTFGVGNGALLLRYEPTTDRPIRSIMGQAKYETFKDEAGEFRWRLRAANGEVVAQSESYTTERDALRGAEDAASASAATTGSEASDAE